MSYLDENVLSNLERLSRVQCTPEEEEEILSSLERVLEYANLLNEVDVNNTPSCNFVLKGMVKTTLREDEVKDLLASEQFLSNAPDRIGNMIRVPPVLKNP